MAEKRKRMMKGSEVGAVYGQTKRKKEENESERERQREREGERDVVHKSMHEFVVRAIKQHC